MNAGAHHDTQRRIRRSTLLLALLALGIYIAYFAVFATGNG
jgi:hypothetical protein